MHSGFEFWSRTRKTPRRVTDSLEQANVAGTPPTGSLAWTCEMPGKNHLRRVMPHAEEQLLDALVWLLVVGR